MKKLYAALSLSLLAFQSFGQTCPTGYNQTQLNWDNLSFINSTTYGTTYATTAIVGTQAFAFGKNKVTVKHTYTGTNVLGEDSKHTGEAGTNGAGDDLHFIGNGSITFTFQNAVQNVKFSVYDIDVNQRVQFSALNATTPAVISLSTLTGSTVNLSNNNTTTAQADGASAAADVSATTATVNVSIPSPVTSFTITLSNTGTVTNGPASGREDGSFWISDITACSNGSFPINYQQTDSNKPFTGQPDYFLTTPDNNSVYMVDPTTGKAWLVFTETGAKYVNSFAYDPYRKYLYYVVDGSTNAAGNKAIKRYDFNTETSSVIVSDITSLGILSFDQGVESAAASYYDDALYIGIEGGIPNSSSSRESMVWRINFDANGNPLPAYQVMGVPSTGHDWGDFVVKDGVLYDFNTNTSASGSQFKHFNLTTGTMTNYATTSAGQAGMSWTGDLYSLKNTVAKYNQDGTLGTAKAITVVSGPAWVGNAGDASENFKPKMDFGDAPDTYDPAPKDPAVHEMDPALKLGSKWGRQWSKTASPTASSDANDDGLPYVAIFNQTDGKYLTTVNVYNNTGAKATVAAWVDFNNNGIFESNEGIVQTVSSSATMQSIELYWSNISTSLPQNSNVFMRIRITSAINNMTVNNPTGYFPNGEVEDYIVLVNATTLAAHDIRFDAVKANNKVQLQWQVADTRQTIKYIVYRSADGANWNAIHDVPATAATNYVAYDYSPLMGKMYYRIAVINNNMPSLYSAVKTVTEESASLKIETIINPVIATASVLVSSQNAGKAVVTITDPYGRPVIRQQVYLQRGDTRLFLPVSPLPPAVYILTLQKDNNIQQKKFLISN